MALERDRSLVIEGILDRLSTRLWLADLYVMAVVADCGQPVAGLFCFVDDVLADLTAYGLADCEQVAVHLSVCVGVTDVGPCGVYVADC
jgi:hypothetical protein